MCDRIDNDHTEKAGIDDENFCGYLEDGYCPYKWKQDYLHINFSVQKSMDLFRDINACSNQLLSNSALV